MLLVLLKLSKQKKTKKKKILFCILYVYLQEFSFYEEKLIKNKWKNLIN